MTSLEMVTVVARAASSEDEVRHTICTVASKKEPLIIIQVDSRTPCQDNESIENRFLSDGTATNAEDEEFARDRECASV